MNHSEFIELTITMATLNVHSGLGGPFAALVVKDGEIIGRGTNLVIGNNDPTAHAEIMAIRDACRHLKSFQLTGCTIYCSCEPCPMCFGAIFWARPDAVFFAAHKKQASNVGFDDSFIYQQIELPASKRSIPFEQIPSENLNLPFEAWAGKKDRVKY